MGSSDIAIHVSNLSKMYKVYQRPSDMFWEVLTRRPRYREFWALRDVSFDVGRGEVVGVIGRNGAGKSTLLKILAGTLDHTSGQAKVSGKLSAILELGTGFHAEFSGRENIYMGGMCLGMSREEINRKIAGIIDFSELGAVIDQPFKTYSSGMQARLTFSVAISVDPDIFIVDEALSAGDMLFAEKCFRRIRDIASSGATVFFVTHGLATIYELCSSGILMHHGRIVMQDAPRKVGYEYERILNEARERSQKELSEQKEKQNEPQQEPSEVDGQCETVPIAQSTDAENFGGSEARIEDFFFTDSDGHRTTSLTFGQEYVLTVRCRFFKRCTHANVSFRIQSHYGTAITGDNTLFKNVFVAANPNEVVDVRFKFRCLLSNGTYVLGGGIAQVLSAHNLTGDFHMLHLRRDHTTFDVVGNSMNLGHFALQSEISVVPLTDDGRTVSKAG